MTDNRFTKEELQDLFGDSIPMEAVKLIFQCPPEWTMEKLRSEIRKIASPAPKRLSDEELVDLYEGAVSYREDNEDALRSQILERMKQKGPTRGEVAQRLQVLLELRDAEAGVFLSSVYGEAYDTFLSMFPEGDQ